MMSLDDAILHCKDRAREDCTECAKEHQQLAEWLKELKGYKDLEKQRKLIKPPCKVGNVTYSVRKSSKEIIVAVVERIEIDEGGNWVITSYEDSHRFEDFGKTVFLAKGEAETALKELENKD